jgi:hypothetical protein
MRQNNSNYTLDFIPIIVQKPNAATKSAVIALTAVTMGRFMCVLVTKGKCFPTTAS